MSRLGAPAAAAGLKRDDKEKEKRRINVVRARSGASNGSLGAADDPMSFEPAAEGKSANVFLDALHLQADAPGPSLSLPIARELSGPVSWLAPPVYKHCYTCSGHTYRIPTISSGWSP